ncbi:MAG TPA: hypothetical protein VLR89_08440 [Anaerolineaceae bacterium]|nr:hypothetical protein [Anaerolineaceae bacterium]
MKLNSRAIAALVLVIIFGGILVTTAMGYWQTESSKVPATYTEGEFAGQANPADIRGSYSFNDVADNFDIPLEDLAAAFRLDSADPGTVQLKELETIYAGSEFEIGTGSVRVFTALYKGLPYDLTAETSYLLPEAAAILKARATLGFEQLAFLDAHTLIVQTTVATLPAPAAEVTGAAEATSVPQLTPTREAKATEAGHTPIAGQITGQTKFQDLLDWGVKSADIETALGEALPSNLNTLVKDWASSKGLPFSELKTKLQALVDATK